MDLSKLPKLSDTKSHTPAEGLAAEPLGSVLRPQPVTYRQPNVGVDIWISLIIGLLMLAMSRNFGSWALATMRHQPFPTGYFWSDDAPYFGREETYFELTGYTALYEMGLFLFGIVLLVEAAAKMLLLLKPSTFGRLFLMFAIFLTLCAVLLNIYACLKLFDFGLTPVMSGLAVAFGGWILFDEWATLKAVGPFKA